MGGNPQKGGRDPERHQSDRQVQKFWSMGGSTLITAPHGIEANRLQVYGIRAVEAEYLIAVV